MQKSFQKRHVAFYPVPQAAPCHHHRRRISSLSIHIKISYNKKKRNGDRKPCVRFPVAVIFLHFLLRLSNTLPAGAYIIHTATEEIEIAGLGANSSSIITWAIDDDRAHAIAPHTPLPPSNRSDGRKKRAHTRFTAAGHHVRDVAFRFNPFFTNI